MNHDEQDLRDRLARLADLAPPAGLETRIWTTRQRRIQRAFGIAGIAAASVLVAVTLALQPRPDTDPPAAATVAAQPSPASARDDDVVADIRAIDHALQLAYTRNASEDEVAPLWKARQELLLRLEPSASDSGFI